MIRKFYLLFALLIVALWSTDAHAQGIYQTTSAHSTTRQWHGINVLEILDHVNDDAWLDEHYPHIKQTYTKNPSTNKWEEDPGCGFFVYLYNAGIDRFMIEGGDWGMEGRLFYEDFGREVLMILEEGNTGKGDWKLRFSPAITEHSQTDKCRLTCNVPSVTRPGSTWENAKTTMSTTTIMDGYRRHANWYFERVEDDPSSDTYTYYMYQQYRLPESATYGGVDSKTIKFRFGAAYGEFRIPGSPKGNGYYVHIDDDRTCWTSAGNGTSFDGQPDEASPWGNYTKVLVGNDLVDIDELYQWRIISEAEFIRVLNEETVGLNPSISSLVPDRDFTRNANDFDKWVAETPYPLDEFNETNGGKYGFTWGYFPPAYYRDEYLYNKTKFYDTSWNEPVVLKKVFNNLKTAKYGYMAFEGVGTVGARFEVPRPGWYEVSMSGISFAPENHPAFFYAMADGAEGMSEQEQSAAAAKSGYQEIPIYRLSSATDLGAMYSDIDYPKSDKNKQKKSYGSLTDGISLSVGEVLTKHSEDFLQKFWIYVDPVKYEESGYTGLTVGIKKEYATKTKGGTNNDVDYYYDSDWVVLDNVHVSYMGLAPAFLYENEESLQYLVYDEDKIDERPGAAPDNIYGGSLSLARTLKKNQWNSFSMPIPLTGEQIRNAFGDDASLLELHSIGGLSHNSNIIDFQSVGLKPMDPFMPVVVPGKFYLLKPTVDPVEGLDPRGLVYNYYDLGRNFFTVNTDINDGKKEDNPTYYKHYILDPDVMSASEHLQSWNGSELVTGGDNDGDACVSYVRTPGYSTFAVTNGIYNGSLATDDLYAPLGSYVMSNNRIYEINKDTRLKGFRGWIKLSNSVFAETSEAKISVNGVVDIDGSTGIGTITVVSEPDNDNTSIYDLGGRKVGNTGSGLSKGIYIAGGKKYMVY